MAYFEDYNAEPLRANIVPKEGIYLCKISDVVQGQMDDGKRYVQVKCLVKSEGTPVVSIFLTEGNNFNGNLTAFYDTFNIDRGNMYTDSWKEKRGYLKICLVKKGEWQATRLIEGEYALFCTIMSPHYEDKLYHAPERRLLELCPELKEYTHL